MSWKTTIAIGFIVGGFLSVGTYMYLDSVVASLRNQEAPVDISGQLTEQPTIEGVYSDVNQARVAHGLGKLALSQALNDSAYDKCLDMQAKNYWSHYAPDGTAPWDFMKKHTTFTKAGENLAKGYGTSEAVTDGWMHSPSHRDNILDPNFHQVGYSVCDFQGTKLVVQHFTN